MSGTVVVNYQQIRFEDVEIVHGPFRGKERVVFLASVERGPLVVMSRIKSEDVILAFCYSLRTATCCCVEIHRNPVREKK